MFKFRRGVTYTEEQFQKERKDRDLERLKQNELISELKTRENELVTERLKLKAQIDRLSIENQKFKSELAKYEGSEYFELQLQIESLKKSEAEKISLLESYSLERSSVIRKSLLMTNEENDRFYRLVALETENSLLKKELEAAREAVAQQNELTIKVDASPKSNKANFEEVPETPQSEDNANSALERAWTAQLTPVVTTDELSNQEEQQNVAGDHEQDRGHESEQHRSPSRALIRDVLAVSEKNEYEQRISHLEADLAQELETVSAYRLQEKGWRETVRSLKEAEDCIRLLNVKCSDRNETISRLQDEVVGHSDVIASRENDIQELSARLELSKTQVTDLEESLKVNSFEWKEKLEQHILAHNTDVSERDKTIFDLRELNMQQGQLVPRLQAAIDELMAARSKLDDEKVQLLTEHSRVVTSLQQEIDQLMEALFKKELIHSDAISAIQHKLVLLEDNLLALVSLPTLEERVAELTKRNSDAHELEANMETERSTYTRLFRRENTRLAELLVETQKRKKEITDALEQKISVLEREKSHVDMDLQVARVSMQAYEASQQNHLQSYHQQMRKLSEQLQQSVLELQSFRDQADQMQRAAVKEKADAASEHSSEIVRLTGQLLVGERRIERLEGELSRTLKALSTGEQALLDATKQATITKRDNEELRIQLSAKEAEVLSLIDEHRLKLLDMDRNKAILLKYIDEASAVLLQRDEAHRQSLLTYQQKIDDLTSSLEERSRELRSAERKAQEVEAEQGSKFVSLTGEIMTKERLIERLKKDVAAKNEAIEGLENAEKELMGACESLREESGRLALKVAILETEKNDNVTRYEATVLELQEAKAHLETRLQEHAVVAQTMERNYQQYSQMLQQRIEELALCLHQKTQEAYDNALTGDKKVQELIAEQGSKFVSLADQLIQKDRQIDRLNKDIDTVRNEALAASQFAVAENEAEVSRLTTTIESLTVELQLASDARDVLVNKLAEVEVNKETIEVNLNNFRAEVEQYQQTVTTQLAASDAKAADLSKQLQERLVELDHAERLRQEAIADQGSKFVTLSSEIMERDRVIEKLRKDLLKATSSVLVNPAPAASTAFPPVYAASAVASSLLRDHAVASTTMSGPSPPQIAPPSFWSPFKRNKK